jgi:hypothetical protein
VDSQRLRGDGLAVPAAVYYLTAAVVLSESRHRRRVLRLRSPLGAPDERTGWLRARLPERTDRHLAHLLQFGYSTAVTPEDGMDVTSSIRSNVLSQSVVVTRTMDYWGRTGGISVILPYRSLNASSNIFSCLKPRSFGCRLSLAGKHFRSAGADARAIPVLRATALRQLSSLRGHPAWKLRTR